MIYFILIFQTFWKLNKVYTSKNSIKELSLFDTHVSSYIEKGKCDDLYILYICIFVPLTKKCYVAKIKCTMYL